LRKRGSKKPVKPVSVPFHQCGPVDAAVETDQLDAFGGDPDERQFLPPGTHGGLVDMFPRLGRLPPVPLSCIMLKPVTAEPSRVKPPWLLVLLASAAALAMSYGRVAPGNFIAPLLAPMRGRHMGRDRSIQLPKRGIWGEGQANRGK